MTEKAPDAALPEENPELKLAAEYVRSTDRHIFLTGKAGTGKTTFLHNLKHITPKRMVVTAPTGVAAINAGGVTLHSFFQLPLGPFVPGGGPNDKSLRRMYKFSKEKRKIIKSLDLLVIDEISMVRADLLDAVDAVLRRYRRNAAPFGGAQLLMIGDLHQLSPVVKTAEWQVLQPHYASAYFFSSQALSRTELVTIELKRIYRQSDAGFIRILNQVRDNRLDAAAVEALNRRCIPDFSPRDDQGYITLTTHNSGADAINAARLTALPGKERRFRAEISGDFPESAFPAPGDLVLKKGAQVMFLRNDPSPDKRYFNGKIGKVAGFSDRKIRIACPDESEEIPVEPAEWENVKYKTDEDAGDIQKEVIGGFTQYPLKLAWAITIHKSQGLTFDRAVIDAASAFAHGQVYVALSRCRTLDGVVLSSPIPVRGLETGAAVLRFVESARRAPPSENRLNAAKTACQQRLLLECFDFQPLQNHFNYVVRLLSGNAGRVRISGVSDLPGLQRTAARDIFTVGEKFRRQLRAAFTDDRPPASDPYIIERIGKASAWFQDKFSAIFNDIASNLNIETDNRELGKTIGNALDNLKEEIAVKRAGVKSCENGFSPTTYLRAVSHAEINTVSEKGKPAKAPDYRESDIDHPELFRRLKEWRSRKAAEQSVPQYQIIHLRILIQIAVRLPDNKTNLRKIKGVGEKTYEKYGEDLLAMVRAYREKYGIDVVTLPEITSAPEKGGSAVKPATASDTKQTSFDMFNRGLGVARIAAERGLVESTIQGHLGFFVENGELDVDRLVPPEKRRVIEAAVADVSDKSLTAVKNALGNDYSYGEIRLTLAHQKYLKSQ